MEERTTSLTLMCRNVPPDPLPYYWNWEGEFILSNMYKGDLELLIELELSDGREVQLPYPGAVLVPAGGSKTISFDAGFRTATSENLPEETYALVVRTELQRRCGSEVGTHVFEWRLEGFVNRTTWEPIVPEEIPAC